MAVTLSILFGYMTTDAQSLNVIIPINPSSTKDSINIQEILAAHNTYRAEVGVSPLTWSAELADYARAWANELVRRGCAFEHRPDSGHWARKYGENLAGGSGDGYNYLSAIKSWGDEKANYNHSNNSCSGICGHYTQIVWKKTTQVGCAVVKCKDGFVLVVCNYNPMGNWNGEPPY